MKSLHGKDRSRRIKSVWPTSEQELLLKAALFKNGAAQQAWRDLRPLMERLLKDRAVEQLIPLLYRNLVSQGVRDSFLENLKQHSMLTWTANQSIFRCLRRTLPLLHKANIETLLLKGAALIPLYYQDYGARVMGDFDVLVSESQFDNACEVLEDERWERLSHVNSFDMRFKSGLHFRDKDGITLDLHCHVMNLVWHKDADRDFWDGATTVRIGDVTSGTLSHTDHLVHACIHGLTWMPYQRLSMVADVWTILFHVSRNIDWDRVVRISGNLGTTIQVADTLEYMSKSFGAKIPVAALRSLKATQPTQKERTLSEIPMQHNSGRPIRILKTHWAIYSEGIAVPELIPRILSIPQYLKFWFQTGSIWKISFSLVGKSLRTIGYRIGWHHYDHSK